MKLKFFLLFLLLFTHLAEAKVAGKYEKLENSKASKIPDEKSLDVVHITEVFSFTCPHCFRFNKQIPKLKEKYGNRLKIDSKPIGWSGENAGRLFFIAEQKGIGEEVKNFIFNAVFESGIRNINDVKILSFIAAHFKFKEEFLEKVNTVPVISEMKNSIQFAKDYGIDSTPSIIIENAIKTNGEPKNLIKIIDSLLK